GGLGVGQRLRVLPGDLLLQTAPLLLVRQPLPFRRLPALALLSGLPLTFGVLAVGVLQQLVPPLARQPLALSLRPPQVLLQPGRRLVRLLLLLAARAAQAVLRSLHAGLARRGAGAALPPPQGRDSAALVLAGLTALRGHRTLPVLLTLLARPARRPGVEDHAVLAHRLRAVRAHQCHRDADRRADALAARHGRFLVAVLPPPALHPLDQDVRRARVQSIQDRVPQHRRPVRRQQGTQLLGERRLHQLHRGRLRLRQPPARLLLLRRLLRRRRLPGR